jgi:hypothetical protein
MSAGYQNPINAPLKSFDDKLGINPTGAGYPDYP